MNPLIKIEYIVLIALAAAAFAAYCSWMSSSKTGKRLRIIMALARVTAVLLLAVIAVNPGRWRHEKTGKESEWVILVDNSGSMATADAGGNTRLEAAVAVAGSLRDSAGKDIRNRTYSFAGDLSVMPDGSGAGLKPDGQTTDIIRSGKSVLERYKSGDAKLAGMFILSDGRQIGRKDSSELSVESRAQEVPIYTMSFGGPVQRKDLSVSVTRRHYVAFKGQKLKIAGIAHNSGMGNLTTDVLLTDASGAVVSTRKIDLPDGGSVPFQLDLAAAKKGSSEYRISIPNAAGEISSRNNTATVSAAVLEKKISVFVAEGQPGWDSKFLIQLLRKQSNMEVTSVHRLTSEKYFRVEPDASKTLESEKSIFPDKPGELSAYDIVILGKGMEYFLTKERIKLLGAYVRDQGGNVIFARGKPYSGRFPELEELEAGTWGESIEYDFSLIPSQAGEHAGLFGNMLPAVDDPLWKKLPTLKVACRFSGLKGFCQVLAEGKSGIGGREMSFPMLVSRRYGKGMITLVNAEGLWQWDFFQASKDASAMYKDLWPQLIQWGVAYSEFLPGQEYSISMSETSVLPDTPVHVRVSRRSLAGAAAEAPVISVTTEGKQVQESRTVAMPDTANRWSSMISLATPGIYKVEPAGAGQDAPFAVLEVRQPPSENDDLSADPDFLRRLSEESGGAVVDKDKACEIVMQKERKVEETDLSKAYWMPLWDRWWFLCGVLAFLSLEVFLRRRNGLL